MAPTRSEPVAQGPGSSEDDRDATDRKGSDPPHSRGRALDQVRAFVEGSEAADFAGADRESVYEFVRRALVRLGYERLGKSDKGLVKRYLAKVTGLSRAQLTRLIGQYRETGRIKDRRGGAPACPFERRYTRADIRPLAALGQMSGPAHGGGQDPGDTQHHRATAQAPA